MKKHLYISVVAIILLVFSSMLLSVNAHSGKTDSNGGHTNHNTGEYHYHHGYSAHDHYDMDGDGDVDCPYDFNDKTSHGSDDRTGINSDSGSAVKPDTQKEDSISKKRSLADIVLDILEYTVFAIAIWLGSSYFLSYIFVLIWGDDRGCSISMISGAAITLVVSIWLVVNRLS